MDDRKIVDLSRRRAEERRQQRKAALSRVMLRFRPGSSLIAWAVLLAVAVAGYFWSDASSRFEKAPPTAIVN
jgi:hypothetical protein